MAERTLNRTNHLNFQFILDSVLAKYFELPDEDRVAQYRDKTSEDMEFHDLYEVVRNEMTMRAKEMGLTSFALININEFDKTTAKQ